MPCPQCQHDNPAGVKFCGECGTRLELTCSSCGVANPPGNKFCHECGTRLVGAALAPASSVAPTPPAPTAYIPQHLAERILTSRGALAGERKQVTVLLADLKGSMELLADRDPEDARRILDPVLERMMEAVHRYEGTVNQVQGDGIMALFGAPLAHEDHAVRACYAALRMQENIKQYASEVQRADGIPIQIRVGLNSGEVVVRSIGSDLRMDYTAVGQTTHLAARMEQMAMPGSILLAPDTLQLAEGYIQVKPLGPMVVKGLSDPLEVYELTGAGTARSRLQATAARGLTKFVGRDAELEALRRTLEQASVGHGQVVALMGEPGVGKSRLLWEFCHSHRTEGWLVLETASVSYGKATPYLPVIELLKTYCGIEARDSPRRMREKVLGKVLGLDEALRPTLPALLALLDVPSDDPTWQALGPPQRRQRTLDALKRLQLRESLVQPLLLVCEDLHWIDAETQALLDSLVESLPGARVLLLVNYRPEYQHGWASKTYYMQLRLDPLPAEGAEEVLQALLGVDLGLEPLKRLLVQQTEGNPFFLEESVRTLVETGVLAGNPGAYRLAKPVESTRVPATVQAVLGARIDRLPPEDKRLLQCAAVIGKDVPYSLLLAIAELREDWLRESLADLRAGEFLYETTLFPDLEYTFKHALTHEVAYSTMLQDRRRLIHARIAAAIEQLYPDRLAEQAERLAHHAFCGEMWETALVYARQAASKAAARSAHREVTGYLEQALAALEHQPSTRDTIEQAIDIRLEMRGSLNALAQHENTRDRLREAERLAEALPDEHRLALVSSYLANCLWQLGEFQLAAESGHRALDLGRQFDDPAISVPTNHFLGQIYWSIGRYAQSIEFESKNLALLDSSRARQQWNLVSLPAVSSRVWLVLSYAESGEFAAAMARSEEALAIAEGANNLFSLAIVSHAVGQMHLRKGDVEKAIPMLERGFRFAQNGQIPALVFMISSALGGAYTLAGRATEAVALLEPAVLPPHRWEQSLGLVRQGELCLLLGRREANDYALRAVEIARSVGERGNEAWALRLCGQIAASASPPAVEQAEGYYRQSLALAEERGMRPLAAHCHLGLGTLYQKTGRDDEAQAELAAAAEMYRAMEMPFWLQQAEATLAQVAR